MKPLNDKDLAKIFGKGGGIGPPLPPDDWEPPKDPPPTAIVNGW